MLDQISIVKGIHPGLIVERELKKRNLRKGAFAISIQEYPQTLVSIIKGKRRMNPALSLKIEQALGFEEGYLMVLQVYYDIAEEKQKLHQEKPNLNVLRPVLFWDTTIDRIDWQKHKKAVIRRVFERGSEAEKQEINRFYGKEQVREILLGNGNQAIL